ncbi:MAG: WavQ [Steroidobacteraceae bacterium]
MKYKYIIYAPPYDENGGGAIALHRLCHLINECGGEAYLHPFVPSFELHHYNAGEIGLYAKAIYDAGNLANYRINETFRTPVLRPQDSSAPGKDCIVVYPEIAFGNPLRATNVVRWLLHNPGHHTGKIYYGPGEIYYRYADFCIQDFNYPGSETADTILRIQYIPIDLYREQPHDRGAERAGTAYCLRKGRGRPPIHDTAGSILIDGKSHAEIAATFKSVKQFISYDPYTHYSYFAAIAGCESIVAPLENTTKEQWKPNVADRYGLAYGFDDLEFALTTRPLALERQMFLDQESKQRTHDFMSDIEGRLSKR